MMKIMVLSSRKRYLQDMVRSFRTFTKSPPGFWDGSLAYPQSFVTVMAALSLGLAMHVWVGYRVLAAVPPTLLLAIVIGPLVGLAVAARLSPGNRIVRWVTGIPFAMMSTGALGMLAVFGGILPQKVFAEKFGVGSMWESWPFLIVGTLVLANLVGSAGRRLIPLSYTNVVYQLTHLGLAVGIAGGMASSLFLERRTMVLFEGVPSAVCHDRQMGEYKAPFMAELKEFNMETYPPTLTVASIDDSSPDGMKQVPGSILVKRGVREQIGAYRIVVEDYIEKAAFNGKNWQSVEWKSAVPAAKIQVTNAKGEDSSGWVSCGGLDSSPSYLMVGKEQAILMNPPRPKKFESKILVDGKTYRVGVNEPAHISGVTVYQFSYDEKLGRASSYSVLELVRDPALPVVYGGIFALLAGTVLHLWNGVGGKR